MSTDFTLDIYSQPRDLDIKWLSANDWATLTQLVTSIPAGWTIKQAAITVKLSTADADDAVTSVQRVITATASTNGQITTSGTTATCTFYMQPADTALMQSSHYYDIQIWAVDASLNVYIRTVQRGRIYARADVTNTTDIIDTGSTVTITDGATLSGSAGDSLTLTVEVRDSLSNLLPITPTYTTSNPTVATVGPDGTVYFWSNGTCTISATVASLGIGDSIAVTVSDGAFVPANGDVLIYDSGTSTWLPGKTITGKLTLAGSQGLVIAPTTGTDAGYLSFSNTGGTYNVGADSSVGGLSGTAYALTLFAPASRSVVIASDNAPALTLGASQAATFMGTLAVTGATTIAAGLTVAVANALSQVTIGESASVNTYAGLRMLTGSAHYAWLIGAQYNAGESLEITPSTAQGGTTFSTPIVTISQNGAVQLMGTLAVTGVATLTAQPILSSLTAGRAVFTDGAKGLVSNAITGTGSVVMSASPTLTGTVDASGALFAGHLAVFHATNPFISFTDGGSNTGYLQIAGGNLDLVAPVGKTVTVVSMVMSGTLAVTGATTIGGNIVLTTNNSYVGFALNRISFDNTADTIRIETIDGSASLTVASRNTTIAGNLTVSGQRVTISNATNPYLVLSVGGNDSYVEVVSGDLQLTPYSGKVKVLGGMIVGSAPTGGGLGTGTINMAGDIYKNGTAYTNPDYVFEFLFTGKIKKYAHNEGATSFKWRTLQEVEKYARRYYRLPGITDEPIGMFKRADFILENVESLYGYLFDHEHRIEALEKEVFKPLMR